MYGTGRSQGNMAINSVVETDFPEEFVEEIEKSQDILPRKIDANPKNVEKGLAKLVLTLIELIRKLLEKQAMRRVEAGSLSDEQIENVGETLMKLENKMEELKEIFGLKDEELNLNLGPLGNLM
jgi:hypothetical protein